MIDECEVRNRLAAEFESNFTVKPVAVSRAPGRLEVLGNHTDYNEGFVLSAAVGQATSFAIAPRGGRVCRLRDIRDGSALEFNLDEIDRPKPGDWGNYVKGVVCELRKRGVEVGAFDGAILSTVPLSAGMSSSAALEMSAAMAFAAVFDIDLPKGEWARIGQGVENNYMGLRSGLLDQFSSLFGERDSLILCDFRSVEVLKTVKVPEGLVFVVVNSMVKHNLVDSAYNQRRASCEAAVAAIRQSRPEVAALRDVDMATLDANQEAMAIVDYRRAAHVVGENQRVMEGVAALEKGDATVFGALLRQSHQSSRDMFENSCPELDYLVELSEAVPGCLGSRLSGGGFGGISIHLVAAAEAEDYRRRVGTAFKLRFGKEPETIVCSMGAGATVEKL